MTLEDKHQFSRASLLELLDLGQSLVLDLRGHILHWTTGCQQLYGYTAQEAAGQLSHQLLRTRFPQPLAQMRETLERTGRWAGELLHQCRDGRFLTVASLWALHRNATGEPVAILQTNNDITGLKHAETALQESEERFRGTFESAAVGITQIDPEGRWLRVNPKLCQTLGYTEQELIGQRFIDFTYPDDREEDLRQYGRLMQGELDSYSIEKRYLRKDGQFVWVRVTRSAQRDESGRLTYSICVSVIEDIGARKEAEAALVASRQRLFDIINSAMDAIITLDQQHRIVLFNPAAERMFGCTAEQALGGPIDRFIPDCFRKAHQDHVRRYADTGETARDMGRLGSVSGLRADGQEFPVEASISRVVAGGERLLTVILRDITERKAVEEQLQCAKEVAEAANRTKDQFLAVLSHELRNPLTPVLAVASMLQEDPRFDADTKEALEVICRNASLEALLIDDLLDVTRIARGKVELDRRSVDLCVVLKHATEVCRRDIEARGLRLAVCTGNCSHLVNGDATRLQQVFWNLLQNAIKFTPPGGRIEVRCRRLQGDDPSVRVEVSDTGMGIEPQVLPRIFKAFEQGERGTTRRFGGLGLGLAISKAMVDMHGGILSARSDGKGKGATFTVQLPLLTGHFMASSPASPAAGQGHASAPATRARLRILLVEDHGDTARILRRVLSARGHEVEVAGDVATAIKAAADSSLSGRFDLLVSDLGLPDGSGLDLIRALRDQGAVFPAIALSGYGQEQDVEQAREAGFAAHLTKPVTLSKLEDAIAAATAAG